MVKTYGKDLININIHLDEQEEKVLDCDDLVLKEYDLGDGEYRYTLTYRGDEMLTAEQVHDYLHAWYDEDRECYEEIAE